MDKFCSIFLRINADARSRFRHPGFLWETPGIENSLYFLLRVFC